MFGFAVGLPALFRAHIPLSEVEDNMGAPGPAPGPDDEHSDHDDDEVYQTYGRFRYSLRTLFFALVGNFDSEVRSC